MVTGGKTMAIFKGLDNFDACSIIPFHTETNRFIPEERKRLLETLTQISNVPAEAENMKKFFEAAEKCGAKKEAKCEFMYDKQGKVFRACITVFFATEAERDAYYEAVSNL